MSKIYTKTGDQGKTSLFSGKRVLKSDIRVESYGSVDELNSMLGVVCASLAQSEIKKEILTIQKDLFEIGSALANPSLLKLPKLKKRVKFFEKKIDELTKSIPLLSNFILPGGSQSGSLLHLARTVCRRVERQIVLLANSQRMDKEILIYFNRLSDLLFTYARYVNYKEKQKELIWQKDDSNLNIE